MQAPLSHHQLHSHSQQPAHCCRQRPSRSRRRLNVLLSSPSPDILVTPTRQRDEVLLNLNARIRRLGGAAVLPGNQKEKELIDEDLLQLERIQLEEVGSLSDVPSSTSRQPVIADPRLLGSWDLLYASNGTAVTRAPGIQALVSASQLPGVGVARITQRLTNGPDGTLQASNEATFGLGPLGTWSVALIGKWLPGGSNLSMSGDRPGQGVKVVFERFKIKPVGVFGFPLPKFLPEALLSLGGQNEERGGAEWYTTYLCDNYRVGSGRTGNKFLFRRMR